MSSYDKQKTSENQERNVNGADGQAETLTNGRTARHVQDSIENQADIIFRLAVRQPSFTTLTESVTCGARSTAPKKSSRSI